ncbi:PhzF family phenazine biosynthesis protein [Vulcanococcus limneticus]|uniref:PhzF family phenazine biosynthesis protein n=1 Tax=Vulcanococcus limneticus TaxID=2170428 RepID=UPI00398BF820
MSSGAPPAPVQAAGSPPPLQALLVEAFAAGPLQGNGAAVVRLEQPAAESWMQALAASFNQSETAFLLPLGGGAWALRWFTPSCEVPLCGHATLAAALALGHWGELAPGAELTLHSRSGGLRVQLHPRQSPDGGPVGVSLDLPSGGLTVHQTPTYLAEVLGAEPLAYWGSALGYRVALLPDGFPLAALAGVAEQLQGPDRLGLVLMQGLAGLSPLQRPAVLGHGADYQLRFFAPGLGIAEDPVTGSAHALVAPWWCVQLGRERVVGWQCSQRRGGMQCEVPAPGLVRLTGTGHLLWDGRVDAGNGAAGGPWGPCDWSVCHGG